MSSHYTPYDGLETGEPCATSQARRFEMNSPDLLGLSQRRSWGHQVSDETVPDLGGASAIDGRDEEITNSKPADLPNFCSSDAVVARLFVHQV
jgi:hypothetical protein